MYAGLARGKRPSLHVQARLMIRLLFYVNNAHFAAHIVDFFAEGLAAVFAVHLPASHSTTCMTGRLSRMVDEAAANTDLARGAAHNYGAVVALLKSLTKAQLLARTQQVVDIGRGHGAHARFAAAARVERNLGSRWKSPSALIICFVP